MEETKSVKLKTETWKRILQLKIDWNLRSIDEVIERLLLLDDEGLVSNQGPELILDEDKSGACNC